MTLQGSMLSRIEGWAKSHAGDPALHDRNADGTWATSTWAEYWESVRRVGKGLMSLGLQPEDCVAIVGANRRDWVICQHGINAAQGIPAPLYTTLLTEQMAYIIGNAQSKIVICDDETQLNKYLSIAGGDSTIEHIVTMDDLGSTDPRVVTLAALMEKGDSVDDAALDARLDAVKMDDVALLVYTSGTTGLPKGAMLTHRGIDLIAKAVVDVFPALLETKQQAVSYLPLCHAAEQGVTNFRRPDDQIRDLLLRGPDADQGLPRRGAPDVLPGRSSRLGEVRSGASGEVGRSDGRQSQARELGA